jgi:hypothetical protein
MLFYPGRTTKIGTNQPVCAGYPNGMFESEHVMTYEDACDELAAN